jgi:hypothetical protein
MATTNEANTVHYIQNKQNSAEKRFGLNLMINMLSQTKNSAVNILLDATVNHVGEFLIITKGNKLPTVRQFIDMLRFYPHGDIPFQTKQKMIAKLSGGIFDESLVKENLKMSMSKLYTPSLRQRLTESDGSGTESDEDDEQSQSGRMVQTKSPTDDEMAELIDELMLSPNRLSARDKEREEELIQVRQGSYGGNI